MSEQIENFDLIIIGAAAAGLSGAVYAARRGLKFAVVSKDIGGEVNLCGEVENWPGIIHTTGIELAKNFHAHAASYETRFEVPLTVESIEPDGKWQLIKTVHEGKTKIMRSKAVLVSSGIHPKNLGVKGEEELKGRGVTYCTVCDGPLYRKKRTITIGAGNSALESALMMSEIGEHVTLITKYKNEPATKGGFPPGEDILIKKIKTKTNVEIIYSATVKEIFGENKVEGVKYLDENNEEKQINAQGVMIHVGMRPNSSFVPESIKKNPAGEIEINLRGETSVPGIFAAGDVTNVPYKQIAIAAGSGVVATLSAIDYINRFDE